MQHTPDLQKLKQLQENVKLPEQLISGKDEIYLYCPDGYGKSRLTGTLIEKRLGVPATVRNWKSVKKLYELSNVRGTS